MTSSYKLLLLTSLYLAQGLPYGFFTQALPVLMREQGLSLKAISATSFLFLPWALKFLWAPLVDHYGSRRGWIMPLQWLTALGAGVLAFVDLQRGFYWIFAALFLFNIFAAMQDVATDGLAVNLLSGRERGLGNGVQVGAYRLGMVFGGGLLLWVFARQGWSVMFACMSGLLLLTCVPILFLREPLPVVPPVAARPPMRVVLLEWMQRLRLPGMMGFIVLIGFYKFGDSMAASLVGPMMKDYGLSKEQIALIKGTLGSGSTLFGAAAGAWLAFRQGRRKALLWSGLLQTASLMLYALAAWHIGGLAMFWAACIAEHLLGGMAVVALFTLMMDASDPEHASTDYTVLACALVIVHGLASFTGATIADAMGYGSLFVTGTLVSAAGCLTLVRQLDRGRGPARLRQVWPLASSAKA